MFTFPASKQIAYSIGKQTKKKRMAPMLVLFLAYHQSQLGVGKHLAFGADVGFEASL